MIRVYPFIKPAVSSVWSCVTRADTVYMRSNFSAVFSPILLKLAWYSIQCAVLISIFPRFYHWCCKATVHTVNKSNERNYSANINYHRKSTKSNTHQLVPHSRRLATIMGLYGSRYENLSNELRIVFFCGNPSANVFETFLIARHMANREFIFTAMNFVVNFVISTV